MVAVLCNCTFTELPGRDRTDVSSHRLSITDRQVWQLRVEEKKPLPSGSTLTISTPYNDAVFPHEISAPIFRWVDHCPVSARWLVVLRFKDKLDDYNFAKQHGIQRNSPVFWQASDWHYRRFLAEQPVEAGLFDMYRFHRIAEKSDANLIW